MEIKEKLLTLINACINDKSFYDKNSGKNIELRSYQHSRYSCSVESKIKNEVSYAWASPAEDTYGRSIDNDAFNKLVEGMNLEQYTKKLESFSYMNINFSDFPPIHISLIQECVSNSYDKKNVLSEFYVDEIKKIKKSFWNSASIKKIGTIKYEVLKVEYSYKVAITSGSLKTEISIEEFSALCDKVVSNREKFSLEIDQEKLEERLKQYSK